MEQTDNHNITCEPQDLELEELVLQETLVSATGLHSNNIQVGIKGDPTLRDSVFTRGKHKSMVDELFPDLEPQLEEMMLHRSVYRTYIGFNSGEVRTCSVFDPMREEVHQAEKLCQYVPDYWKRIMHKRAQTWNPIREEDLPNIIKTLQTLRGLDEFYLRNATICIVQHVVRLQFNCDGTQLVDAENYRQFLQDNIGQHA